LVATVPKTLDEEWPSAQQVYCPSSGDELPLDRVYLLQLAGIVGAERPTLLIEARGSI
jgi:hypothetical protein